MKGVLCAVALVKHTLFVIHFKHHLLSDVLPMEGMPYVMLLPKQDERHKTGQGLKTLMQILR